MSKYPNFWECEDRDGDKLHVVKWREGVSFTVTGSPVVLLKLEDIQSLAEFLSED